MCVCVQKEEKARQERLADLDRHQESIEQLCVYVYRKRRRPGRREFENGTDIRRA